MHYRIGTRGSKLALVQTEYVKRRMEEAYPEDTFELVIIKTTSLAFTQPQKRKNLLRMELRGFL